MVGAYGEAHDSIMEVNGASALPVISFGSLHRGGPAFATVRYPLQMRYFQLLHVYVNPIEVIRFCDMHASFCAPSNLASGSRCRKNRHGHCSFLKYTSKLIRAILEVNKMEHTGAFIVQVANGATGEASLPWTRLCSSGLLLNIDTLKVASGHGEPKFP